MELLATSESALCFFINMILYKSYNHHHWTYSIMFIKVKLVFVSAYLDITESLIAEL